MGKRKRGRPRRFSRRGVDEAIEKRVLEDSDWKNQEEWNPRLSLLISKEKI